jgi:hypothetical protein
MSFLIEMDLAPRALLLLLLGVHLIAESPRATRTSVRVAPMLVPLLFFPSLLGLLAIALAALVQLAIDRVVVPWADGTRSLLRRISWAHVARLLCPLLAWWLWTRSPELSSWTPRFADTTAKAAFVLGVYLFCVQGGSRLVAAVLADKRAADSGPGHADHGNAGRVIGKLERALVLTLVWLGEWSAVGFILAAKSVARFKELDDREFAETYLVGTLTSVLIAGAGGLLLLQFGLKLL